VEHDEAGTLDALRDRRKNLLNPLVALHKGRIVADGRWRSKETAMAAAEWAALTKNARKRASSFTRSDEIPKKRRL
jgi:hypothetical protein